MRFIVKVPVTVTLCIEVTAKNKAGAVKAANEKMQDGVVAGYMGVGCDISRPPYIDADVGWWEDFDQPEPFLGDGVEVERYL